MTTATRSISSLGHLCQQLQRSYGAVRGAIVDLRIKPALVVNGVEHYSDADVDKIREHLAKHK